jgi:hypothetical protein
MRPVAALTAFLLLAGTASTCNPPPDGTIEHRAREVATALSAGDTNIDDRAKAIVDAVADAGIPVREQRAAEVGIRGLDQHAAGAATLGRENHDRVRLYTEEATLLAASLEHPLTTTLADYTTMLNTLLGPDTDGATLTPRELADGVRSGIQDALQAPDDPNSYAPLLFRELGLRHDLAVDLATPIADASGVTLDRMQTYLLTSGYVAALDAAVTTSTGTGGWTPAVTTWTDDLPVKKWSKAKVLAALTALTRIAHAALLTGVVTQPVGTYPQTTHYRHAADDTGGSSSQGVPIGRELIFQVEVRMVYDLPEWLVGFKVPEVGTVPPRGPIKGVEIRWEDSGNLAAEGAATCGPDCSSTDANGIATMRFRPNVEKTPGVGVVQHRVGVMFAAGQLQSSLGDDTPLAWLIDPLQPRAELPWDVAAHRPPGFTFSTPVKYVQIVPLPRNGYDRRTLMWQAEGRVCAEDPYTTSWDLLVWHGEVGRQRPPDQATVQLVRGMPTRPTQPDSPSGGSFMVTNVDLQLIGDPPTDVEIRFLNGPADEWPAWSGSLLVPVTVDSTCPAPGT